MAISAVAVLFLRTDRGEAYRDKKRHGSKLEALPAGLPDLLRDRSPNLSK